MPSSLKIHVQAEIYGKMSLGEIDKMLATEDITATEVFNGLRLYFMQKPNRTRLKQWERFFRRNSTLFGMLTDEDIALLHKVKNS